MDGNLVPFLVSPAVFSFNTVASRPTETYPEHDVGARVALQS
jgi:hypothetical protein